MCEALGEVGCKRCIAVQESAVGLKNGVLYDVNGKLAHKNLMVRKGCGAIVCE